MGDKFQPTPAVLVISEAVIALPFHHTGTLLVNKPVSRIVVNVITLCNPVQYPDPPDSKAELSVDGACVGGVQEDGDCTSGVLPLSLR